MFCPSFHRIIPAQDEIRPLLAWPSSGNKKLFRASQKSIVLTFGRVWGKNIALTRVKSKAVRPRRALEWNSGIKITIGALTLALSEPGPSWAAVCTHHGQSLVNRCPLFQIGNTTENGSQRLMIKWAEDHKKWGLRGRDLHCLGLLICPRPLTFASSPSLGTDSLERPGVAQKMWYCIILTCCAHIICIETGERQGDADCRQPSSTWLARSFYLPYWALNINPLTETHK